MPYEIEKCPVCGAAITASSAAFATCEFCHTVLEHIQATAAPAIAPAYDASASPFDAGSPVGSGRRIAPAEMATREWKSDARLIWPEHSMASSEYGAAWGAGNVIGPPRVFPRHGDIRGAWASRSPSSAGDWLECHFPDAPPATGLLVFETYHPGGLWAITDETGGASRLLWRDTPGPRGNEARVLEVELPDRHTIRVLRFHLDQRAIGSWSEIDSVAVVANQPVPALHARSWALASTQSQSVARATSRTAVSIAAVSAVFVVLMVLVGVVVNIAKHARSTAAPTVATFIRGATASRQHPEFEPLRQSAVWASRIEGYSSQYGATNFSAARATGVPDAYPSYGDMGAAWASLGTDDGFEWITLGYATPVDTSAVVVVETYNPGAVVRIDDMSDEARPTALWSGTEPPASSSSSVLRIDLPSRRTISRLRVVLDTRLVTGWNEIDAVGLNN